MPPSKKTPLPHTWREDGKWQITAMLASIPPADYLTEARAFESHHLGQQTLSADWGERWRAWCRERSPRQPPVAHSARTTHAQRTPLFGDAASARKPRAPLFG